GCRAVGFSDTCTSDFASLVLKDSVFLGKSAVLEVIADSISLVPVQTPLHALTRPTYGRAPFITMTSMGCSWSA
ncbi:MAG: hypothetical protein RMJ88_14585, partial [Thermogemmata sp.]|nr:hypothetical protein [Thermogemmata sp.]